MIRNKPPRAIQRRRAHNWRFTAETFRRRDGSWAEPYPYPSPVVVVPAVGGSLAVRAARLKAHREAAARMRAGDGL